MIRRCGIIQNSFDEYDVDDYNAYNLDNCCGDDDDDDDDHDDDDNI